MEKYLLLAGAAFAAYYYRGKLANNYGLTNETFRYYKLPTFGEKLFTQHDLLAAGYLEVKNSENKIFAIKKTLYEELLRTIANWKLKTNAQKSEATWLQYLAEQAPSIATWFSQSGKKTTAVTPITAEGWNAISTPVYEVSPDGSVGGQVHPSLT